MATKVEKLLPDGKVEVLHHNLADQDASELAQRVLAAGEEGVKVRLTPFRWDAENACYVPDMDAARELPIEPVEEEQAADEFDVETAGKDALKAKAAELGLEVAAKAKLEELRQAVKDALAAAEQPPASDQ